MGDVSGCIIDWTNEQVAQWAKSEHLSKTIEELIIGEDIDGKCILCLEERDIHTFRDKYSYKLKFGDIKRFWIAIRLLQRDHQNLANLFSFHDSGHTPQQLHDIVHLNDIDSNNRISPPLSIDGRATTIQPELFKTFISLAYAFLVTWITAIVMVIVHERVPDMKRYPPLPDIFLDNVPHIPWAFCMCELTGTVLFIIWGSLLVVHKHRMVLLRRFFALAGTVFLLRCVTMLITSLSVPGTHLQCNPNDHQIDDTNLTPMESILIRISRAYTIWSGLGMSIRGVRTCGDYMFSGHTVALTTLNFFITEYTPRHLYFLHTMTWLLNMFGIFFILAAHEHYSIDVFVAFYITSRLFLYYHTLANNQALMSRDSNRTRIWFPMFSYFESSVDGIIPNEYDSIENVLMNIFSCISYIKDCCMLTARRFWIAHNQLTPLQAKNARPNTALNNLHLSSSPGNNGTGNGNLSTTNNETSTDKLMSDDIKKLLNKDI